jgi:hypothetical protein
MNLLKFLMSLIFFALTSETLAQSQLRIENNLMYTDAALSDGGLVHKVSAMIDTGSSVCMIDSTFAIDSCHIKSVDGDRSMGSTYGRNIKSSYFYLDSLSIAGVCYPKVWCFVVDLAGKFQQFAPKFIVGGDLLKRGMWMFDMINKKIMPCVVVPDHVAVTLHSKNYTDAAMNHIYFKGKIGGHSTHILLDTGATRNELTTDFGVSANDTIVIKHADIAQKLTYNNRVGLCKNLPVEISKLHFYVDFIKPREGGYRYPRINTEFLQGKRWVLDYRHRYLYILAD